MGLTDLIVTVEGAQPINTYTFSVQGLGDDILMRWKVLREVGSISIYFPYPGPTEEHLQKKVRKTPAYNEDDS